MDTELLRTFLEVRSTRHFGRAADKLCITQAAVSARIRQLEELLGATLFKRTRNNIHLSAEGEQLVPHAEAVLLAIARARQDIQTGRDQARCLRLGLLSGLWSPVLQNKLAQLMDAKPELTLNVESLASGDLQRRLLEQSLDAAICYDPSGMPELDALAIGELTLDLYRARPAGAGCEAAAVYLDWGPAFARFYRCDGEEQAAPRLATNLVDLAVAHLARYGGDCYLPRSYKGQLVQAGIKPVRSAASFKRPLNYVFHSSSPQSGLVREVAGLFGGLKL